ncbi:SPOR domain-containing protein [Mucilaginibacter ginsenosidivorans]|uniref:SPOR domain-containing protein n=1 Tax=Mucilaginibacter ginsenosidivorans TaxID=398053 RepID=A0A5B8UQ95_9SPHI|nr:SPOR domain-containing protein [Mucilaginibacter ginsenosidivorans]QEC61042.1 SPOR domain-containing protein [Mucilaginibacter ginsenosidivorans]
MNNTASHHKALRNIIGCCFFMLFGFAASAQTKGKVEVIKDPKVDTLIARRAELNKAVSGEQVNGFRVQIFTGANRKDAYSAQTKFQEEFPDIRSYVIYSEPNFKVRVGDFRSRMEAEKLQDELRKTFMGTFIITEKVNQPKPDSDE